MKSQKEESTRKNMKLFFIITGIGLGHTMREAAIIKEIKSQQPTTEIVIAGYKNSYRYFKGKYPVIKIHGHKFPEGSFSVSRVKSLIMNLPYPFCAQLDKAKLVKLIQEYGPDRIIVDIQPVGIEAARACNVKSIAIYNLDINEWQEFNKTLSKVNRIQSNIIFSFVKKAYSLADKVIIPTIHKPKSYGRYSLINPILRLMPYELPSEKELMKKLQLTRKPILVMLGGSKFGFKIADKIVRLAKGFDEHFIFFGYKELNEKNITSFRFKENFLEYLKTAKACILLSGHTALSEVVVYKKPALVFPFRNYVEHYINVSSLRSYIIPRYINSNIEEEQLSEYIKELLDKAPELEKALQKLTFPVNGAKEAAEIILR